MAALLAVVRDALTKGDAGGGPEPAAGGVRIR
jgi:hypothetical protein